MAWIIRKPWHWRGKQENDWARGAANKRVAASKDKREEECVCILLSCSVTKIDLTN